MEASSTDKVSVTIDGRSSQTLKGTTILDAARSMGISIPTLCHYRGMTPCGACRICLVELETPRGGRLVPSCSYPIESPVTIRTDTEEVKESRRTILELLLAQAPNSKDLAEIAAQLGVTSTPFANETPCHSVPSSVPLVPPVPGVPPVPSVPGVPPVPAIPVSQSDKCILCGLCVRVCNEMMGRGAISLYGRGAGRKVRTAFGQPTDQCQACGACALVCPTGAIDLATITARRPRPHLTRYDQRLNPRPSIDLAHPQASPRVPSIDRENCVHFKTGECGLCAKVCEAGAINYDQKEKVTDLEVGAVVLTPGFEAFDATRRGEFGFGFAPNVVTNIQFERILSASGPTAGHIVRPWDGKTPKRLAFIQCVGSRDAGCDNEYCSSVCCMAATKEAILAKEHEPELDVTIFFLDLRAFGKDFDRYCERAKRLGVRYVRSFISRTYEMPGTRSLRLNYFEPGRKQIEEEFDMIVLSLGLEPSASLQEQAERLGVILNRWGFADTRELSPLETSRPGVFVGGAFQEPKDIPDTVMQASAAAAKAMALLAPARGTRVRVKEYPPEREITDEAPRIGVFVCHCGSNIASVVDVERVVELTRKLPNVAFASHNVYTCADDSQNSIKDIIREHRLNRVIIASCTPRTHEPIFREMMRDVGLNPYLLEMANIRDQCSWVHSGNPEKATEKAADLVRMTVGRAAGLKPLKEETVPVNNAALVVGGGAAGMTAALALAGQGFPVHLVEKTERLGGIAHQLHYSLEAACGAACKGDVQAFLAKTIEQVTSNRLIHVHLNSTVTKVEGHIGDFKSKIKSQGADEAKVEHGVVVVATGGSERKPASYGYGQSDRVMTQLELSDRLGRGDLKLPANATIAMIQCVEQRNEERPFCSRVCCATAVKNALILKERNPDARIIVLYRDMRTYGFREAAYRQAREKGVLFVRYDETNPPQLSVGSAKSAGSAGSNLTLRFNEPSLARPMEIAPDLLVLAAPMAPGADRETLSELLRVPLNADGFFLEAHMKLRPVDFASEGLFLCGTAHAPKFLSETISQANAVAGRAASILSRKQMPVSGQTAWVDPDKCISCMTCTHICPYMAPMVGEKSKAEIQGAVCMGCGSCASECPAKAIQLRNYLDTQVLGALSSLLTETTATGGSDSQELEVVMPEKVGVTTPSWKKGL